MATVRKLIVEVVDARDLPPKDGHGTVSPYVQVDYYGQRKRTQTVIKDLNPKWNELLEFNVEKASDVFGDVLELDVYHDKNYGPTTRNNFLGRLRLTSSQFVKKGEEALIYFPLQKKSLFSFIQGDIGLKIYYVDEAPPPPPPLPEEPKAPEPAPQEEAKPTKTTAPPPAEEAAAAPPESEKKKEAAAPVTEQPPPSENEKPAEEPPAEGVAQPPETAAAETAESNQLPPPEISAEKQQLGQDDHIEMMSASSVSKSVQEIKFVGGINGPQPMARRSSGVPSYTQLEPTEQGCREGDQGTSSHIFD